ncbi:hypothetical protein JXB31_03865 [Candidatus Woesearchaeota archaeon]|nr:hypothetical protein [Candidatus Woesearchaeota archaeon]
MKKSKIFPRIMFSIVVIACCSLLSLLCVSATTYVSHTASQITPGNFNEGMYSFVGTSKVGIGTTSPQSVLHIKSSTANSGLTIQTGSNSNNQGIAFLNSGGSYTWHIYRTPYPSTNYAELVFASGLGTLESLTPRVIFDKDGNVGIGTTSPAAKLEVAGNIKTDRVDLKNGGYIYDDGSWLVIGKS